MRFGNATEGDRVDYPAGARALVMDLHNDANPESPLAIEDVYVVWFSYVLGNWKALVSTTLPDDRYYEVTHRGEGDGGMVAATTYVDTYVKTSNVAVEQIR